MIDWWRGGARKWVRDEEDKTRYIVSLGYIIMRPTAKHSKLEAKFVLLVQIMPNSGLGMKNVARRFDFVGGIIITKHKHLTVI